MNTLSLNSSAVTRILGAIAFLLVLASMAGQFSKFELGHGRLLGLVPVFDLDSEQNIPTYFSMLLMLCAALLLGGIAALARKHGHPDASNWSALSAGFFLMAFDEGFRIHESLAPAVRTLLGPGRLGVLYFAWVVPGIALVVAVGLFFLGFLLRLPAAVRVRFLTAGAVFVGGAVGLELLGGRYAESHGMENWTYTLLATVEEGLEMAGLIAFIRALLIYYAENFRQVTCRFDG